MSTFRFGQAEPPKQMLLPAQDVTEMRRELRQLEEVVEDWKKRNPRPDLYDTKWTQRLEAQHGDKIRRINYLRNQLRAVQSLLQTSSEGSGRNMTARGRYFNAKKDYERGDGEGPLEAKLVADYNEAYYRYLYEGERDFDDEDEFVAAIKRDSYGYSSTLLNPRTDPYGRHLLCDMRMRNDFEASILCLAGDPDGLPLGETHPDPSEGCLDGYLRMHSGRPGGARTQGMGLGTTLYLGTMLGASQFGNFKGIYSMDGGCGSIRTEDADQLWQGLVQYGLAEEGESDSDTPEPDPDEDIDDEYGSEGYSDDYYGGGEPVQYMSTRKLLKHPAIAFTCSGNTGALPPHHKSNWREVAKGDRPAGTPRYGGDTRRRAGGGLPDLILEAHWADVNTPKLTDRRTVEMLATSVHGASPMLVVFIAEAIKNSKHPKAEDLAVAYLTRPDISIMVRGNQRVMELLGQQRLPGLGGLSGAAMREVMGVMRTGRGLGQGDNPLHLPKKSAELKRLISQYPEF